MGDHGRERHRVLVLGADGFLGRHVARALTAGSGIAEALFSAGRRHPPRHHFPVPGTWVELDLVEDSERAIGRMIERVKPSAVVNCVGAMAGSPAELRRANLLAPSKLVDVLTGGFPARLVHLGSAAEYGPLRWPVAVAETTEARPASEYGATKLAATQLVSQAAEDGRLSATVVRVFNPVGAGASASTLVGRAALTVRDALWTRAKAVELGPLDTWRDFIDARDVARAVLSAAMPSEAARVPSILNVGRGVAVSSRWLVHELARTAHFEGEILERAEPSPRSALVAWQEADITAVRAALDWEPVYSLTEALGEVWSACSGRQLQRWARRALAEPGPSLPPTADLCPSSCHPFSPGQPHHGLH